MRLGEITSAKEQQQLDEILPALGAVAGGIGKAVGAVGNVAGKIGGAVKGVAGAVSQGA